MLEDLPNEILLEIFEISCDIEHVQRPHEWHRIKTRPRKPKEAVTHLMSVCARWKNLIQEHDFLWITSIKVDSKALNSFQDKEKPILESSGTSDIDVAFRVPSPESAASQAIQLLTENIIPHAKRWRSFWGVGLNQEIVDIVWRELNKFNSLPRLLSIHFHGSSPLYFPPSFPATPQLYNLSTTKFFWDQKRCPFSNLCDLELSNGTSQPFTSNALRAALFPSSQTLRTLSLHVSHASVEEHTPTLKLTFPSLTVLQFWPGFLPDLVSTLANFCLPALEELRMGIFPSNDATLSVTGHRHIELCKLQRLIVSGPASCVSEICSLLELPLLQQATFVPGAVTGMELLPENPNFVVTFPSLQTMSCDWSQSYGHLETLTRFLQQFDLSSLTTFHLHSTIWPLTRSFVFPNLTHLKIDSLKVLQFINAPCLKSLQIREDKAYLCDDEWTEAFQSQIDLSTVEELHIHTGHHSRCLPDGMAPLFTNLESLFLDIPETIKLPHSLANAFPRLKSCQLYFRKREDRLSPSRFTEIKLAVEQRITMGLPLHSLRVSTLPSSPSHIKWFEEKIPDFGLC